MWNYCHELFRAHPWGGSLISILLAVLAGTAVAWLVKSLFLPGSSKADRKHSLNILRERFARGEISEEDFLRMKGLLQG